MLAEATKVEQNNAIQAVINARLAKEEAAKSKEIPPPKIKITLERIKYSQDNSWKIMVDDITESVDTGPFENWRIRRRVEKMILRYYYNMALQDAYTGDG